MSRTDKFYEMCTTLPVDEIRDDRDEAYLPELVEIARLRDSGALEDAIEYGLAITKMFSDFDLPYYMVSHIYFQRRKPEKALELALDAIGSCPRKYRLYSVVGLAEFDQQHLANALVWWCRSILAQGLVSDYQEYEPFLHLSYAADAAKASGASKVLLTMVDAIEPDSPRLSKEYTEPLTGIKGHWARPPFRKAIEQIVTQYFA
jgi:hypothetical protein